MQGNLSNVEHGQNLDGCPAPSTGEGKKFVFLPAFIAIGITALTGAERTQNRVDSVLVTCSQLSLVLKYVKLFGKTIRTKLIIIQGVLTQQFGAA
jgi:hypothetical protein